MTQVSFWLDSSCWRLFIHHDYENSTFSPIKIVSHLFLSCDSLVLSWLRISMFPNPLLSTCFFCGLFCLLVWNIPDAIIIWIRDNVTMMQLSQRVNDFFVKEALCYHRSGNCILHLWQHRGYMMVRWFFVFVFLNFKLFFMLTLLLTCNVTRLDHVTFWKNRVM